MGLSLILRSFAKASEGVCGENSGAAAKCLWLARKTHFEERVSKLVSEPGAVATGS